MEDRLKPVFIPSLSAILISAEDKKGKPLTEQEVLDIRDSASVVMMKPEDADKMADSREYDDIDPENCWYDWQMLRRELGRKPDLEPGVRYSFVPNADKGMQKATSRALQTLNQFRTMIDEYGLDCMPMIKYTFHDAERVAHMWLIVNEVKDIEFTAQLFEVPDGFQDLAAGDSFIIQDSDIKDWMINLGGTLYGGYSLRYQREGLTPREKAQFDAHIGITSFAE